MGYAEGIDPYPTRKGHWKLEDVNDSSGGGYNLTNNGTVTFVNGKFNKCANFVRTSSQWLNVNNNLGITGGAITMSAWANYSGTAAESTFYGICGQIDDSTNYVFYRMYYYKYLGVDYIRAWRTRSGIANTGPSVVYTMSSGVWYHVLMTYDTTNIRLYLNGKIIGGPTSDSGNGIADPNLTSSVQIGQIDNIVYGNKYWNGMIDEVIIDNAAWSDAKIRNYYSQAKGQFRPSIV